MVDGISFAIRLRNVSIAHCLEYIKGRLRIWNKEVFGNISKAMEKPKEDMILVQKEPISQGYSLISFKKKEIFKTI